MKELKWQCPRISGEVTISIYTVKERNDERLRFSFAQESYNNIFGKSGRFSYAIFENRMYFKADKNGYVTHRAANGKRFESVSYRYDRDVMREFVGCYDFHYDDGENLFYIEKGVD